MAYRYNRINWQNKPNVATPISAENLNKMDKGIDDNDKAIGDLVQLNTLNKSSLVSAVNELNNKLAWEEWKTATLQNGWTGTIRYTKNGLNEVRLVLISLNPGTVTGLTIITTLPVGYRPERNVLIRLVDSSGRANGAIMYLNQNGNLYLANDSSFTALSYSAQVQFYAS